MTLERKAELIEAMNRDCVPGCENCRRNRVKAILSALKEVRAEALAEKTTNGLPGSTAGANPEGSAPVAALVATWRLRAETNEDVADVTAGEALSKIHRHLARARHQCADELEALLQAQDGGVTPGCTTQ
jgi:hypothetical protein